VCGTRERQLEIVAHWRPVRNTEYTKPLRGKKGRGKKNIYIKGL